MSKVQCLQVSIDEPLCPIEWVNLAEVINQVKGVAWLQLLPVGMKSSLTLQFNAVHILPQSKIPFELPIETFLKNHESNERKVERRNLKDKVIVDNQVRQRFESDAKAQGLIVLPDFQFRHVIYKLTEANLSQEGLVYSFTKCATYLNLKDDENSGVTMVLTSKWMMVAQLSKPYMHNSQGYPCYLDGFSYTGLVQMQSVETEWPMTVCGSAEQRMVFESLAEQSLPIE